MVGFTASFTHQFQPQVLPWERDYTGTLPILNNFQQGQLTCSSHKLWKALQPPPLKAVSYIQNRLRKIDFWEACHLSTKMKLVFVNHPEVRPWVCHRVSLFDTPKILRRNLSKASICLFRSQYSVCVWQPHSKMTHKKLKESKYFSSYKGIANIMCLHCISS